MEKFTEIMNFISVWTIPLFLLIPLYGAIRGVKVYEVFVEGAKDGFPTAVRIMPFLVAMLVSIGVFRASGAMGMLVNGLRPMADFFGFPAEILPMAFMRSLSGGGSQAMMQDLMNTYGADSLIGNIASVIMGSSETTLYVLAVYFGSISIRNSRHALAVGLLADFVAIVASVYVCKIFFA